MARAPHYRIVNFLKDLVEEWNPEETDSDDFREQIKEAIIDREISVTTASVYITAVKRACMELGKSVNPELLEDLERAIDQFTEDKKGPKVKHN